MKLALKIIASILGTFLIVLLAAFIFLIFFDRRQVYITDHSERFPDVTIQPLEAIAIATPYLPKHGTVLFRKDKPLTVHLSRCGDWYYVMNTNYPAKTIRYYLQPAVKVHVHSGKIEFSTR